MRLSRVLDAILGEPRPPLRGLDSLDVPPPVAEEDLPRARPPKTGDSWRERVWWYRWHNTDADLFSDACCEIKRLRAIVELVARSVPARPVPVDFGPRRYHVPLSIEVVEYLRAEVSD